MLSIESRTSMLALSGEKADIKTKKKTSTSAGLCAMADLAAKLAKSSTFKPPQTKKRCNLSAQLFTTLTAAATARTNESICKKGT